jgi:beta-lactamase class C
MKFLIKILPLFILLAWSCAALADESWIQETMQQYMQDNKISGAAVILYSKGEMQSYYFGQANPQEHIPVNEETIFELGSITKTFTGLLLAQSVAENKVNLHDFATNYLSLNASKSFKRITLLDLATYTAGLPFNAPKLNYNAADSKHNSQLMNHFIKNWKASYEPNTKILYSNFGYGILGKILADSEGKPLPELMKTNILEPLGMTNSGLDLPLEIQQNIAQGFTATGQRIKNKPSGLLSGAWAMKASVADMQAYLKAALLLPEVPETINQAMKISQSAYCELPDQWSVGLAWKIISLDKPGIMDYLIKRPRNQGSRPASHILIEETPTFYSNALIEKTGATDGFRSYIGVIPQTKTGIVVLINRFTPSAADFTNVAHGILLQASGKLAQ